MRDVNGDSVSNITQMHFTDTLTKLNEVRNDLEKYVHCLTRAELIELVRTIGSLLSSVTSPLPSEETQCIQSPPSSVEMTQVESTFPSEPEGREFRRGTDNPSAPTTYGPLFTSEWPVSDEDRTILEDVHGVATFIDDSNAIWELAKSISNGRVDGATWIRALNAIDGNLISWERGERAVIQPRIVRLLASHGIDERKISVGTALTDIDSSWVEKLEQQQDSGYHAGSIIRIKRRYFDGFQKAILIVAD